MRDPRADAEGKSVIEQSFELLEFLAAVAREIGPAPVRDVSKHPFVLWPTEVPEHRAVKIGPSEDRSAWLEVPRMAAPAPVSVPEELADIIVASTIQSPTSAPQLDKEAVDARVEEARERAEIQRETDVDVLGELATSVRAEFDSVFGAWLRTAWASWVERTQPVFAARDLYSRLFELHLRLDADSATHELVWGHAVLSCRTQSDSIVAPLLTTTLHLAVDPSDATIRLVPEQALELETDAIEGTGLPGTEALVALRASLREVPPDVWSPSERLEWRQRFAAPLGLDAALTDSAAPDPATGAPRINDGWVVFMRRRPMRQERFYGELAEKIRDENFLPEALASVVADKDRVDRQLSELGQVAIDDDGTASRLLMPLPANDEQERIARQLARSRGVTVQGPPGTGKSHAIVNLISHLVAQGKRVLVTAEKEQALSVLRDKIPAEIRDLSIAVLGSTPTAMAELRGAVQSMQDSLSSLDVEKERRRIAELGTRIDQLRSSIARLDAELVEALRSEQREYALPAGPAKAPEVAEWLSADRHLDVIEDRIALGTALPISPDELRELVDLLTQVSAEDSVAAVLDLPVEPWLPSAFTLQSRFDRLNYLRDSVTALEDGGLRLDAVAHLDANGLESLAEELRRFAAERRDVAGTWEDDLAARVRRSEPAATFVAEQNPVLMQKLAQAKEAARHLVGHEVAAPDGDPTEHARHIEEWAAKLAAGKKIGVFAGKPLKEFSAATSVDGYPITTPAQLELVNWHLRQRRLLREAHLLMSQVYAHCMLPVPSLDDAYLFNGANAAERVEQVLRWWKEDFPSKATWAKTFAVGALDALSADAVDRLAELVDVAGARLEERRLTSELDELANRVRARSDASGASRLWGKVLAGLEMARTDTWGDALDEARRLITIRTKVTRAAELTDRLADGGAPRWARAINDSRGSGSVVGDIDSAPLSWERAKARTWIISLHAERSIPELMERAHEESRDLRQAITVMASRSARVQLKHNQKDRQRVALETWLTAVKKTGKGTGKLAPRYQAAARDALPGAMGSVPIWIMPIYRVMENFDPRVSELFDVVVVDESSQCDLLSLGVLALGKKSVVVGDDKQTTPQRVGVRTERIASLQDQFLRGVPGAQLLTLDESLYSISGRAFPSTIALKEHFRCVPEIIEFSNRYYNGAILPLREVTVPQIGEPLRVVHVENAISESRGNSRWNLDEAAAIADQVAACVDDPSYDGLTFGVVTMMSGPQAQYLQNAIRERIGDEEFERRRLRVGNPPVFQGDERNVIFISMVTHETTYAATSQMYAQWANVAFSRAQDQVWIFHSMDPAALNHEDQRRAMIEYAQNRRRREQAADLYGMTDSQFERDLLTQLLDRGYDVTPQYQVGRYRIDFVVQLGAGERLAIECDGDRFHGPDKWDDDVRRQRVLERIGWSFWRVRASEYYLDPEAATNPLWERLESMKARAAEVENARAQQAKAAEVKQLAALRAREELAPLVETPQLPVEPKPRFDSTPTAFDESDFGFTNIGHAAIPSEHAALRHVSRGPTTRRSPADIRQWARSHGFDIGDRGRIPQEIEEAYLRAQSRSGVRVEPKSDAPQSQAPAPEVAPRGLDVIAAWRTGTPFNLDRDGDIVARNDGRTLASVIGRAAANKVRDKMRTIKPQGGAFKVDEFGTMVVLVDGEPTFVMQVSGANWFHDVRR